MMAGYLSTDMFIQALKTAAKKGKSNITPEAVQKAAMNQTWQIAGVAGPTTYPNATVTSYQSCGSEVLSDGTAWKTVTPYVCSTKPGPSSRRSADGDGNPLTIPVPPHCRSGDLDVVPVDVGAHAVELGSVPRGVHLQPAELVDVVVLLGRALFLQEQQLRRLRVERLVVALVGLLLDLDAWTCPLRSCGR